MEVNDKFFDYVCALGNSNHFLFDAEKMQDFIYLTKREFLDSYSYLTEEEYDNTMKVLRYIQGILIESRFANQDRINSHLL